MYDTTLTAKGVQQLNIPQDAEFNDTYVEDEKLHLLFNMPTIFGTKATWFLVTYHQGEKTCTKHYIPAVYKNITDFKVRDQYFIATYISEDYQKWNDDFIVYDLDRKTTHFRLLGNCEAKTAHLKFLEFDSRGKNLIAGLYLEINSGLETYQTLNLLDVSLVSNECRYTNLPQYEDRFLVGAKYVQKSENEFILAGIYDPVDKKQLLRDKRMPFNSDGYFTMHVKSELQVGGNMIDFEFTHPQMGQFKRRISDIPGKGMIVASANTYAVFHCTVGDILVDKDGYHVVFEIFYPISSQGVFYGYAYHQSFVYTFNNTGEVINDHALLYIGRTLQVLKPMTKLYLDANQQLNAYYCSSSKIEQAQLKQVEGLHPWNAIKAAPLYPDDEARIYGSIKGKLWYDNTFFISGYQEVKNKNIDPKKRDIYYISKAKSQ